MKQKMIYSFLIISILGSFHLNKMLHAQESTWDRDNYGKVVGKIVDAKTGKPVDELFHMILYDCVSESSPQKKEYLISNENGTFEMILKPGKYCLEFSPLSDMSKYSIDYTGDLRLYELSEELGTNLSDYKVSPAKRQTIVVNKGQVTKFVKKVKYGGKILVIIVDQNNNALDIKSIFGDSAKIDITVTKDFFHIIENVFVIDKAKNSHLNENEYMIFRIWAGKVNLEINYAGIGYGKTDRQLVEIKENNTHELTFIIDMNAKNGIEGVISDESGVPVKSARVWVTREKRTIAMDYTDIKGNYKFFGLKDGIYILNLLKAHKSGFYSYESKGIEISNDIMVRKDIILKKDN
jgi:hypothetical protein